ncbi:hypothetical protein BKA69DRAFT_920830 [Paraphysoderma sedebokerense]|nr:hypothetical protein BKA69DRAFT_920830 [Paraphysoderma sedebokerense]
MERDGLWTLENQFIAHNNILMTIAILGTTTNSMVIYKFITNRLLLKPTHMSLVSVVLSDFLSAIVSLIFLVFHYVNKEIAWEWCQVSGIFCCLMGTSALSFCIMGVERYLYIVHQKPFTGLQVAVLLVICWVFTCFLALFPILSKTYHVPQSSPVYCLPNFQGRTILHYAVSIPTVAGITTVIVLNSASYYLIHKKALTEGFKWSAVVPFDSIGGGSKLGTTIPIPNTLQRKLSMKRFDDSAQDQQMLLTAKLAIITLSFCIG